MLKQLMSIPAAGSIEEIGNGSCETEEGEEYIPRWCCLFTSESAHLVANRASSKFKLYRFEQSNLYPP